MKALPLIALVVVLGAVSARAEAVNSESARASLHAQCKREAGKKFTDTRKRSDYVKRCIAVAASVHRGPRFVEPQ
ncbi:MAG TPA: hypothetical protein VFA57_09370 [Pseudolabrys sp.]|nr:hypothetical protein [Pseudolabrys sp.]